MATRIRQRIPGGRRLAVLVITLAIFTHRIASAQNPTPSPPKSADATIDGFYRIDELQSVYLRVADEDLQRMRDALPARIPVKASFRWRDISIDNVSVRFKGDSSSRPTQEHKRSFLIRFNEYDDGQRFLGLRRVSFDNAVQFGSLFSEPIITEILHDQGIKAHRCNYAKLFLNGAYQGVYVNVERIDESFIERRLGDANGLLFKVHHGGPGANLQFLGDDPSAYARAFEPQTKSAKRGQRELVDFIRAVNQTKDAELAAVLDSRLELDDFLRVTAVMLFSGAFDQLTGWNAHNYYLYHDGTRGRWRYLPWDLDVGFTEVAFGQIHVLEDWNAAWPVAGPRPSPLLERIVADPALLRRYRGIAKDVLEKYFEPQRLCATIDARYALIKDALATDPFPPRRITNPGDRSYDDIVASMKRFARARHASARRQLDDPGQRPQVVVRRPVGRPPAQFEERIRRLQRAVQRMERNGDDVLPIHRMMQQVGPLAEQGRWEDAERLVTEALKLAGEE